MGDIPVQPLVSRIEHPKVPYTPLNDPHTDFRLLSLKPRQHQVLPAVPEVRVYCDLETVAFLKRLSYVALSYSWGTSTEKTPIMIGDQVCHVSSNLEEALREIRDEDEDVLLWCDQLCINQHDDVEKSFQVQRMKDIYSDASKVISWLGPRADNSALCMARLKSMGRGGLKDNFEGIADVLKDYEDAEANVRLRAAYDAFCQRSYWQRLWVLQEFALGKDIEILCGSSRISFQQFSNGLLFRHWLVHLYTNSRIPAELYERCGELILCFKPNAASFVESLFSCRQRYRQANNTEEMFLFRVMVSCLVLEYDNNHMQCSDPRDRVFSMMSIVHDAKEFQGFPDYAKSCEDIYEETARQFLRQGPFEVLSYCQFPRDVRFREIATWAPDWFMPTKTPCVNTPWFHKFNASGDSAARQEVRFPDSRRVSLLGIHIDTVESFGSLWNPDWLLPLDPFDTMKYLNEILELCEKSERYDKDEEGLSQVRNVARIAVADRMFSNIEGSHEEKQQQCLEALQRLCASFEYTSLDPPLDPEQQQINRVSTMGLNYAHLVIRMQSRRPFISKSGYVGLAPHHVQRGDEICTFLGSNVAYIIRAIESAEHVLVGETYVHGAMFGECTEDEPQVNRYVLR